MSQLLVPSSWAALIVIAVSPLPAGISRAAEQLRVDVLWRHGAEGNGAEIVAYEPRAQRLVITVADGIKVLDAKSGRQLAELPQPRGFHTTSVAVSAGRLAVAWAAEDKRRRGQIGCYDVETLAEIATFSAGHHPDMVTFSPDGRYLLAANEGEPSLDYSVDQAGSITVIDTSAGLKQASVRLADFSAFDAKRAELRAQGVRIFGPSRLHEDGQATVAEDLEPEYIAIDPDSVRAWVTLQENNAVAEVDLSQAQVTAIHPLGCKDFSGLAEQGSPWQTTGLDASDVDGGWKIRHWPVSGLFQPDGVAVFQERGETYLVTANEGDPREYAGYQEPCPIRQLKSRGFQLAPRHTARFLMQEAQLGRLNVSTVADSGGGGCLHQLHCFGARSFAVWQLTPQGAPKLAYDSGSDFERVMAHEVAGRFGVESSLHQRCNSRGPEPESVVVGRVGSRRLAMVSLERAGGVMVYDLSYPTQPQFLQYLPPCDEDGLLDCAPEGMALVEAEQSPTGQALLIVCNEVSGTTTAYQLQPAAQFRPLISQP